MIYMQILLDQVQWYNVDPMPVGYMVYNQFPLSEHYQHVKWH